MKKNRSLPTRGQTLLPLLEVLKEAGGRARSGEVYERLAEKLDLAPEVVEAKSAPAAWGSCNLWRRRVRWARQDAVRDGLLAGDSGIWELTKDGGDKLERCKPGVCIVIYETEAGQMLWADAETAVGVLEEKSVQLLFTSPPYPLLTPKHYGNKHGDEYLEWLYSLLSEARKTLKPDGSMVLNLMDCQAHRGSPVLSMFKEELLLRLVKEARLNLIQNLYWNNPSKMPAGDWVTVRKQRIVQSVENLYWLSPSEFPKVRQQNALRPYGATMRRTLAAGGETRKVRPCGHGDTKNSFGRDNGGSIPHTLITAPNATSNDAYMRFCREKNLAIHPGRFPAALPNFAIRLMTDPGDLVWDIFAGSNNTGREAETLGRRWVANDQSLHYIKGSLGRFPECLNQTNGLFPPTLAPV